MATPTPGTFPSFPPYQPGALQYTGSEIFLLVTSATATAAATYYDLVTNMVGKVPGVLPNGVPAASDMVTFLQASSGLPMSSLVGNLGVAAGNLPAAGGTGQILAKTSGSNYISSWQNITNFVSVGNGLFTTGNATAITIALNTSIATFGGLANPTGTVGLAAVNGVATTGMRSDAAPPLSQAITPTWTGQHTFNSTTQFNGPIGIGIAPEPTITNLAVKQLNTAFGVVYLSGVLSTSMVYIDIRNSTGIAYFGVESSAGGTLMSNGQPYAAAINDQGGNGIEFGTNNILRAFITGTGSFGIGTSSPPASTLLYVAGTAALNVLGVGTTVVGSNALNVVGTATISVPLAVPSGGIGTAALGSHGVVIAEGTTALTVAAAATAGYVLTSNGSTSDPSFQAMAASGLGTATFTGGLTLSQFLGSTIGGSVSSGAFTVENMRYASLKAALYTVAQSDMGSLLAMSTTTIATFVVPAASSTVGSAFSRGFFVDLANYGSTTVIVAPQTSNLTGIGATVGLGPQESIRIISDGINYQPVFASGPLTVSNVNTSQTFAGGLYVTSFPAGTFSAGAVYTTNAGTRPLQIATSAGTFTFQAYTASDGELDIMVINTTNASTITFTGFNVGSNTGDTYTTTVGSKFILMVRTIDGFSTYAWKALQ